VKVLEVDVPRKRISLTMRMSDPVEKRPGARADEGRGSSQKAHPQGSKGSSSPGAPAAGGALADALRKAGLAKQSGPGKSPRK